MSKVNRRNSKKTKRSSKESHGLEQTWVLRPTGRDDIEGRPNSMVSFKRESCRTIGRIVERSIEVFGGESTATRDDKGDVLVQPNNPG